VIVIGSGGEGLGCELLFFFLESIRLISLRLYGAMRTPCYRDKECYRENNFLVSIRVSGVCIAHGLSRKLLVPKSAGQISESERTSPSRFCNGYRAGVVLGGTRIWHHVLSACSYVVVPTKLQIKDSIQSLRYGKISTW